MSVIVELVFTGIVAFVPLGGGKVAAVMPNGMPSHIPWIIVNKENRDPSLPFDVNNPPGGNGAWRLGAVQLSIDGAPPAVNKRTLVSPQGVASFRTIAPRATVKGDYLKPREVKAAHLKSLWFQLPEGRFSVKRPAKCYWDLKAENPSAIAVLRQTLAQEVVYEVTLPDSPSVTLIESDLVTGKLLRKRVLPVTGNRISIMIGNTEAGQVFPGKVKMASPDRHFKLYYRMLNGVPADASKWPIPFRVDESCDEDRAARLLDAQFLRVGGENCPPAFMY